MKRDARIRLNDGAHIPQLGLGVMQIATGDLPQVIGTAVALGYRHFDTATHYANEDGVGEGLRAAPVDRDELFVTTKLPNTGHGYDAALRAFDASEKAIGRIDLYLVHWPQPPKGLYRDSWRALVRLREEGRVRSIGVSNFPPALIEELEADTGVLPAVNQIQLHPFHQQPAARDFHAERGIVTESWSPLAHGQGLTEPVILDMAERHGRTPAQIILRWHLQSGTVIIPKAAKEEHLAQNFAAWDFALSAADVAAIDALDRAQEGRIGPDPMLHVTA
jgi:2,5-diketo-D-gluconate reductase A